MSIIIIRIIVSVLRGSGSPHLLRLRIGFTSILEKLRFTVGEMLKKEKVHRQCKYEKEKKIKVHRLERLRFATLEIQDQVPRLETENIG